jgi:hypothetical protein
MSTGTVYRTKCIRCQAVHVHQNKPLETVRMHVCERCRVRTVVIGYEAEDRTPKNFETGGLRDGDNETARRLLNAAFAKEE